MNFEQIRQQYPQYNDLSDFEFAKKFHDKFYSDIPLDEFASKLGYDTSKVAAFTKSAAESTLPSAAGLASAVNLGRGGAMLGGAIGGAPGAVIGGIGGGLLGGFGGGAAAAKLQEIAGEYVPESVKQSLGFGKEQRILETQQNPYSSFAGSLAPNLAFFRPGAIEPIVNQAGKTVVSPLAQRGLMGAAGGGLEAGQELITTGEIDPLKVGMAAAFQGVAATPTRLGKKFGGFGEATPENKPPARDPYFEKVIKEENVPLAPAREQLELPMEAPNKYGVNPQEMTVDENGMPIDMGKTIEMQRTEQGIPNQGDLLTGELPPATEQAPRNIDTGTGERIRTGEGIPLETAPNGRLREEVPTNEPTLLPTATPLESAVNKISNGQRFAMSAEERIAFEKAKSAVEAFEPEFKTLSEKQILERMMDRQWVENAVKKSREMDAMYADIAKRTQDANTRNEMIKNRELLADHLDALEERLRKMPTEKVGQGPKTLAAKQLSLKDATANLFDSLAEFTGGKMNFLPGEGLGKSVVEFVRALGREGHTTYQKAVSAAKNALGDAWNSVKEFFKQAWDHVRKNPEEVTTKPTQFDRYAENIRKAYPEATDAQIQKAWNLKVADADKSIALQAKDTQSSKTAAELAHSAQRTGDVWTPDQAINIFSTIKDILSRSIFKEQVVSSGRIQRDLLNHPVTTWVYNLTTKAIEDAGRYARHVLDDFGVGVIPKIRQHSLTFKGAAEMKDYIKWRFENEGNAQAKLPDTFSPEVRKIHELLNKADTDLIERMNRVLERDGKKPITALDNHMVHYWSGPYRAYVYVKTKGGGSRLAFFVSEKSMAEAEKALAWIRKNIPNVDLEKSTGIKFVKSDLRNRSSMFDHLLDLSNEKDPAVLEALQAFRERVSGSQERHLNEQMRQKERAGVQGFLGDKPWKTEAQNYADALDSIRRKYDAGYQWIAAQEIRQQMNPVLQAQQDGQISVGNALMIGQKYVDHALGKNVDSNPLVKIADYFESVSPKLFGGTRRGFNTLHGVLNKITLPYLLALKGTQAVQAVAQPFQSVLPRMLENASLNSGGFASYTHIPVAFGQGLADGLFQMMNLLSLGKAEGIQNQLYNLMGAKDSIAINKAMRELDITRMSLSDVGFGKEGGTLKTLGNVTSDLVFNGTMNLFEAPTRAWSFSAYARQALMDGHDMPTALKMAREAMDTMVNYNPEAAAQGISNLGPLGLEARGLHTFMINYYSQLARYVEVAARSKNAAPLLAYLGMTFALGGAVGFIGMDAADWLLDGVKAGLRGTKHDSPELQKFSVRQWLMENAPESVSVGPLSTATNLGLYGSFTSKVIDPSRSFLENIFPKTFATVQLGKGLLEAPKLLDQSLTDKERGTIVENLAPKAFTQKIRNAYQNVNGTVFESGANQLGLPQYQRTPQEQKISEKGMGIRGLAEVMSTEERANYSKTQKNINESRTAQINKFDQMVVNAMKKGSINQFQQKALVDKVQELTTTWQWEPEKMAEHVIKLQQQYGLPNDLVRRILAIKTPTPENVQKLQELGGMYFRQSGRQQKYGQ